MTDSFIRNNIYQDKTISQQLITQQQELIAVLKLEIVRLQELLQTASIQNTNMKQQLLASNQRINELTQKINNISDNNEALLRTVQVFQRQFIKKDSFTPLGCIPNDRNGNGQFHFEIIRNIKSKIGNSSVEPSKKQELKSPFAEYYGFFLQDQTVQQSAITLFNQIVQRKNIVKTSKIRALGKKSYFHQKFRYAFWDNAIQNRQRISEKLYLYFSKQRQDNLQNKPPRNSIIDLDLRRMDLKLDDEKSKKVSVQIKKLLQIFEQYRPDIKYVQGMSYLAWMFLIRMNPYRSFSCFCNLILSDPFVHSLYTFEQNKLKTIISYFDTCLADKKPKLHRHLHAAGVQFQLFLIEWAYTLYSRAFNLRIIAKIWDLWFSQGYNTFFKVAMTVFELLQPQLMSKQDNDRLIDTIRTSCIKFQQKQFLKILGKQKLFEDLKLQ